MANATRSPASSDSLFDAGEAAATIHADHGRYWATSFSSSLITSSVQFVTTMALARLLTPADFGVIAMVMGVIGIGNVIRNMGLSTATIRQPSITEAQVSVLFWINVGLGLTLACATPLVAPLLGEMYDDPRLPAVAAVLGLNFLLGALPAQHQALLNRNMRFGHLARINVLASLTSNALALLLAFQGHGYWAMVVATLCNGATTTLLAWNLCGWRPGLPRRGTGAGEMVSFGSQVLAFGILSFLALNVHNLSLGLADGARAVGLYNRALQMTILLTTTITMPLGKVAIATLSRLAAHPMDYRSHYRDLVGRIAFFTAPLSVVLVLQADLLVLVLFGTQWTESAMLLRILGLSLLVKSLFPTAGWLHLSRGDARGMMRWGAIGWSTHIGLTLVGVQFGLVGVAIACICSHYVLLLPTLRAAMGDSGVCLGDVWLSSRAPLLAALATAPLLMTPLWLPAWPDIANLLLALGLFGPAYLVLLLLSAPRYRQFLNSVRQRLSASLPRKAAPQ